ncbi:hypothetical protein Acid345_1833 [Candidatus Koribacter versatilis Ellin345]|uniref:Uncharacterized protein n=2 Tax=Candidatus Korobacter versatilis TaxID=658062 RepID=Q1IQL6_KORVE|nr:hypothetical protein Acid345_1833 [Candidatus Koribacter versatilis Ellin345]
MLLAQSDCDEACGKPTAWDSLNKFSMRQTDAGQEGYASWRGQFDTQSFDIQFSTDARGPEGNYKGDVLLVGGRVMAVRGNIAPGGYEMDGADAMALNLKLVKRILGEIYPKGPAEIETSKTVDYANQKTGIHLATMSAEGYFAPPWTVSGNIKRTAQNTIEYVLNFSFYQSDRTKSAPPKQESMGLSGELATADNARIPDELSLQGWTILELGVQTTKTKQSTTYDYGAGKTKAKYQTVGDIRKVLAKDDYPGERDDLKDFTGFWKAKCDDAFGLQIMHHGGEGKYSVAFCGPGGCDDPEQSRPTYITKDPHYKVISETEIKTGDTTYHRCTRDTHPVLKYDEGPAPTSRYDRKSWDPQTPRDWEEIRAVPDGTGDGTIHFVVVPESIKRERDYYQRVGDTLCAPRTQCSVYFWTDRTHIPETAWMKVEDLAVSTASFEWFPRYEKPALHLACWLYASKKAGEADGCSYQPGAKQPPE